jgi:outer membrane protein assembly factor BamD (BamD/ComL family)
MNKKLIISLFLCLLVFISCSSENKDWENTVSKNSITAYEDYLKLYPQGKFADEAKSRIETIYFEKAEATNTISAYEDFLKRYSEGQLADEARSNIEAIYFDQAKSVNSVEAYEDFLNRYSEGQFADRAHSKIEALLFDQAKSVNSVEAYEDFLEKYPDGKFTDQARQMLEKIFPSFSKEKAFKIESISSVVGTGEVSFTKGKKPNTLKITINVTAPVVNGKTCLGCGSLIRIAPNLKVPINPFFTPMKQQGVSVSFKNMVLEGPNPADAIEFIVSGPQGATLKKEGNGFRLVKGEAHFLKTKK